MLSSLVHDAGLTLRRQQKNDLWGEELASQRQIPETDLKGCAGFGQAEMRGRGSSARA